MPLPSKSLVYELIQAFRRQQQPKEIQSWTEIAYASISRIPYGISIAPRLETEDGF
ncbi:hypothetical protein PghCCS26_55480 [Paenibacillus glycanilyticus]|uniref:Uncharacterized protein n=1 Tax=Paenibacillus glycanilyticus TaxID=126569 RepID=A0ABQ6NTH9_9BACL|nr:hypothetical protein PghCCS26_55480 [Paenibacillus glycanilyticus]